MGVPRVARFQKLALFFAASILAPQYANAEWHEASSDHFVIYANQSEKEIREYADRLERYHNAMEARMRLEKFKPSPSNRVTIFVLRSTDQIKKLAGNENKFIAGFYQSRAGGSVAFVPRIESLGETPSFSETVLMHEYAHHFMYSNFSRSYPLWFSEGFAEFYGSTQFFKDGSVGLGAPAMHRGPELFLAANVPIERLLDTQAYNAKKSKNFDEFYGRSWLLFHYLYFSETRKGQLENYQQRLSKGEKEIAAAIGAFGDLKVLDKELDKYLKQSKISIRRLSGEGLLPGPIMLRKLDVAEAAIMPVRLQSKRGVNSEQATELLPDARKIAAAHPNSAAVLSALAEAEFDAGNDNEAIAAADRAVAIDPGAINAIIQKGYALVRLAPDAADQDLAWKNVRKQFVKVNKLENDHPIPLIQYYLSFREQGGDIPKLAVQGLEQAQALAPFDSSLRWMTANQMIEDRRFAEAIYMLEPLANSPHESEGSKKAADLIAKTKLMVETSETSVPLIDPA
jgi:tetratricopeptide (TPR) repeat protein